jgi:hypothetical protein
VLVGVFGLLLLVYLALGWRGDQVERRETAAKRVLGVAADQVTAVRLTQRGDTVRLEKANGTWRIVEPRPLRADQEAVAGLVRDVAEATRERVLTGASPQAPEFGLATPTATVTLEAPSGAATLAVGAEAPVGGQAYARRGDEAEVILVPASVHAAVTRTLFDLRDKRLLDVKAADVTRVEVRPGADGAPVVLERAGDAWRVAGAPEGRTPNRFRIDRLADAAIGLEMSGVLADTRAGYAGKGLDRPARVVTLTLADGSRRTVTVGQPEPPAVPPPPGATPEPGDAPVVVEGDPTVYRVQAASLQALATPAADLLEPLPQASPAGSK